jgi:carbon storage regulator CsrA
MLVLSRRENQKVLFPNLGITVEIVGVKGRNVRLGIDAPPEIRILRAELAEQTDDEVGVADVDAALVMKHRRNNQLNHVALQIQIAQKLLGVGDQEQAMETLQEALHALRDLDSAAGESRDSLVDVPTPKWKALLVEDDANERRLMAKILKMCGFEVETVEDGQAAIEYLQQNERPDCVLMDMQMPRLSGPETIAKIREELKFTDVPIYGVSGLNRQEANVPMGDRGVSGWFSKPVDTDKMFNQIFQDIRSSNNLEKINFN